ncbi:TBC1 domain family member 5-like [Xenia sp. Carnegie-2017]|uniref:TBC1 domain family member 5-like n=1 Tax=Xenia sp. Carnegie-2017 TaxID=2897299 RepID=UPI001F0430E7|nr:TBC1 domain family member 5-like [Xenia sp. Carnegie-2017]
MDSGLVTCTIKEIERNGRFVADLNVRLWTATLAANQDAFHSRITNGLQAFLRGTRQIISKRGPEINDTNNAENRLENKSSGNEKKKPVEMKENNKSSPSSHMFPSDPDDDDLFMMSPRSNRTSASTAFLSKLSSKVRHPSRTDITALQQDHERLQDQVSHFKAEVDKLQSISIYCGSKMDTYINHLQEQITQDEKCMDVVYLSLAGLKQVRDILKGTLTFHGSTGFRIQLTSTRLLHLLHPTQNLK